MCWQECSLPLTLISKQWLFEQMNAIQIICYLNSRGSFSVNDLCVIILHTVHIDYWKALNWSAVKNRICSLVGRWDQYAVPTNRKKKKNWIVFNTWEMYIFVKWSDSQTELLFVQNCNTLLFWQKQTIYFSQERASLEGKTCRVNH